MNELTRIGVWLLLSAMIIASAILAVDATQQVRLLHAQLQTAIAEHDEQMKEQSRLLLERSARAALPEVEAVATTDLGMRFPAAALRIAQ